jgi:hypothetical protein
MVKKSKRYTLVGSFSIHGVERRVGDTSTSGVGLGIEDPHPTMDKRTGGVMITCEKRAGDHIYITSVPGIWSMAPTRNAMLTPRFSPYVVCL